MSLQHSVHGQAQKITAFHFSNSRSSSPDILCSLSVSPYMLQNWTFALVNLFLCVTLVLFLMAICSHFLLCRCIKGGAAEFYPRLRARAPRALGSGTPESGSRCALPPLLVWTFSYFRKPRVATKTPSWRVSAPWQRDAARRARR